MKLDLKKIEILEANSDETLCFINGVFAATVLSFSWMLSFRIWMERLVFIP